MTDAAVSIVVPTLDGGEMLERCLACFGADRADVEVIVVDNGSTDGSVDRAIARFPAIRVVRNETNRGYATACNQGAAQSNAPFVLFLNNDACLASADLDRLLAVAADDDAAA